MTIRTTLRKVFVDKETAEQLQHVDMQGDAAHIPDQSLVSAIASALDDVAFVQAHADVGHEVFEDCEFFETYSPNTTTVFTDVCKTDLVGGRRVLQHILSHPIVDNGVLLQRQQVVKRLSKDISGLKAQLQDLKSHEQEIIWMLDQMENNKQDMYELLYFKSWFLQWMNRIPSALTIYNLYRVVGSPLVGIVSPLTYFIIPYLVLRLKVGLDVSFLTYIRMTFVVLKSGMSVNTTIQHISWILSLVFYFQGLFNSFEISNAVYKLSNVVTDKINGVATFFHKASVILDTHWANDIERAFWGGKQMTHSDKGMIDDMASSACSFHLCSNFGHSLHLFKTMQRNDILIPLLATYYIDALASAAELSLEPGYSLVSFQVAAEYPILSIKGLWHPSIKHSKSTLNDVPFNTPNIILTGPNAGGKSTLLKSLLVNAILSQTITIAAAESMEVTPFRYFTSHMHVPDSKGNNSLFEAEMYRCKAVLDKLSTIKPSEFALVVLDELFNSTNPVEGIAAGYSVLKSFARYPGLVSIVSTHYVYLTKLSKQMPSDFTNMQMEVQNDHTSGIKFTYKIKTGVSRQYIALELLKRNGFDEAILKDAIELKNKLLSPTIQRIKVREGEK